MLNSAVSILLKRPRGTIPVSIILLTLIVGCGRGQGPPPARSVHNPALNVTVSDLPPEWDIQANSGDRLELRPAGEERTGLVTITVGPEEQGINLVAAIESHRAEIESMNGGRYSGAQELSGPLGAAFYSRGRYETDGGPVEDTRIYALHPTASRLLILDYTYPAADDSSVRVGELIELFALVE